HELDPAPSDRSSVETLDGEILDNNARVDVRKAAVASNRIAIPITEKLVFAFDGVKTRWNTAPVRIHRADVAKHCKGARGPGQCIPAYWLAILSARVRLRFASVRQ